MLHPHWLHDVDTEHDELYPLRWYALGVISIAITIGQVDMTIVNVALPHMQGAMSATQDQISWVLTSYIVAAAIATVVSLMRSSTGTISARKGRAIHRVAVARNTTATVRSRVLTGPSARSSVAPWQPGVAKTIASCAANASTSSRRVAAASPRRGAPAT